MNKWIVTPIFLAILTLSSSISSAQLLSIRNYNIEDGLAQSVVNSIAQDGKGYLWFATETGLSRFDGVEFKNFARESGILTPNIYSMCVDSSNSIWLGTTGGLYKFDGIKAVEAGLDDRSSPVIFVGCEVSGRIVYVTKRGVSFAIDGDSAIQLPGDLAMMKTKAVCAAISPDGTRYIGTSGDGLFAISNGRTQRYTVAEGLPHDDVTSLAIDGAGDLIVGTQGRGLAKFKDGSFIKLAEPENLSGEEVQSIYSDSRGALWIGTDQGVCRLESQVCRPITRERGLNTNSIISIHQTSDGIMWFGTFGGGVSELLTEKFIHYTSSTGLLADLVYTIAEDGDGGILLGMDEGGIDRLFAGNFSRYTIDKGYARSTIDSIIRDRNNDVWFLPQDSGAVRVKGSDVTTFDETNGLGTKSLHAIFETNNGDIWFGADDGAIKYSDGTFTKYSSENGFISETVISIFEGRDGRLWFGMRSNGIASLKDDKFEFFGEKDGLRAKKIYSIYEDRAGLIWFGSDDGLYMFDGSSFARFGIPEGLIDDLCYFVIGDDRGYLWIGTSRGLSRFDGKVFKSYTTRDGLITDEFNSGAAFKDKNGYLWFGHIKGVTALDPAMDIDDLVPPKVFISDVRLRDQPIDTKLSPVFEHSDNYLKFDFIAPYFKDGAGLTYLYKLDGLDNDWQRSKIRTVQYTSLPDGRYSFRIKAVTKDGVDSSNEAIFSFQIMPPYWKTVWFVSMSALSLLMIAYGFYRYKLHMIKVEKRMLEEQVEARTEELTTEKEKSDQLLCNILPRELVDELKESGKTQPRRFDSATIIFTDFKGFTNTSATMPADFLVGELNEIFIKFDEIISGLGLEKIKTIGDAYMIAGGLPSESSDHAIRCIRCAMEMQAYIRERNGKSIIKWNMRTGIHSGTVVAGVVGKIKFTYDVWGDTVNMASRMESSCEPGNVNISAFTYHLAKDDVECEYRGKVDIKGKGEVDMYYVTGFKEKIA